MAQIVSEIPIASGAGTSAPTVSVIVPAVGPALWLEECLHSVLSQDGPWQVEVIAVLADHAAAPAFRARFPSVTFLEDHVVRGPGAARNEGIRHARGAYLAFIDDDCVAHPGWLRVLVQACMNNDGRPVCGWVDMQGPRRWVWHSMDLAERGLAKPNRAIRIPGLWGANLCVSREALRRSNGSFIPDVYGAEELGLLGQASTGPVIVEPAAQVTHRLRTSFGRCLRRMAALGAGSAVARRSNFVRGHILVRVPLLIPLLPAGRLALTWYRVLRWCGPRAALDLLLLGPVVTLYLLAYTVGFAGKVFAKAAARGASRP